MRCATRMGLALVGLALAAPTTVRAGLMDMNGTCPSQKVSRANGRTAVAGVARLCPECQRAELRAQGIEIPPPPQAPAGVMAQAGTCSRCKKGAAMMTGPDVPTGGGYAPVLMANGDAMPGHAVVGESMPGYASLDGMVPFGEPAPIGVVQASYAAGPAAMAARPPAMGPGATPPYIPPAPTPVSGGHKRPHILGHVFGLTGIGRERRDEMQRRRTEAHAAISYDPQAQQISEIPASMVYGGR